MMHPKGFRRRWQAWQPSEAQRKVLDALEPDKSNNSIAAELGLSPETVKWHISQLLSETNTNSRQELAEWWMKRQQVRMFTPGLLFSASIRSWARVAMGLLVASVVLGGAFTVFNPSSSERDQTETALQDGISSDVGFPTPNEYVRQPTSPDCNITPSGPDFVSVTDIDLRSDGLIHIGRLINPNDCPILSANRADQSFIYLPDGGTIDLKPADFHIVTNFGNYRGSNFPLSDLGFYHDGEEFLLRVWIVGERPANFNLNSQSVSVLPSLDKFELQNPDGQGILLNVSLEGESTGRRKVAFDSEGNLFIAPNSLDGDLATNRLTGEEINVEDLTRVGTLLTGPNPARTDCDATLDRCTVHLDGLDSWQPTTYAPTAGILDCVETLVAGQMQVAYELEAESLTIRYRSGNPTTSMPTQECGPRYVDAGDKISVWQWTMIDALAPDGSALSAVSTLDGTLYVGEVELQIACPCSPRN